MANLIKKLISPPTPEGWTTSNKERKSYYTYFTGQNIIYNLVSSYLTTYFAFIGVDLSKIATIMLAVKIWDAVNDAIFGVIFDSIKFKSGKKYIPWLRISLFLIPAASIMMFAIPSGVSENVQLAWFAVAYLLWDTFYTLCDVPIYGIITSMTENVDERNSMMSYKSIWGGLGMGITMILASVLVSEKVGSNYTVVAVVCSVIALATMAPACVNLKERHVPPADESFTIRKMFSYLFSNKYLLIFYIGFFFYSSVNISGALNLLASYYLFEDSLFTTIVSVIGTPFSLIGSLVVPRLVRKMDKMTLFKLSALGTVITSVIMWLLGYKNPIFFLVTSFIRTIPMSILGVMLFMFTPDCAEYGRYKTGIDAKGITFSIQTFMVKLTAAISGSLSLFLLGLEYVGWKNVEAENFEELQRLGVEQSPHALNSLWFIYVMIPAIGYFISWLFWQLYKLNDKDVQVMADFNAGKITREEAESKLSRKY